MDVWLSKMGRVGPTPETPPQRRGRLLEPAVAQWYQEEMGPGYQVLQGEEMPVSPHGTVPWSLC